MNSRTTGNKPKSLNEIWWKSFDKKLIQLLNHGLCVRLCTYCISFHFNFNNAYNFSYGMRVGFSAKVPGNGRERDWASERAWIAHELHGIGIAVDCPINHTYAMLNMNAPIFGSAYRCNPAFTERSRFSPCNFLSLSHKYTPFLFYLFLAPQMWE